MEGAFRMQKGFEWYEAWRGLLSYYGYCVGLHSALFCCRRHEDIDHARWDSNGCEKLVAAGECRDSDRG